jgi:nucleotidyltransferase/DNA polymerase involved in DNA repair
MYMNYNQLNLELSTEEQIKNTWAFAIDESNFALRRQRLADLRDYVISSCSKEAKRLGVRAGMRYSEAKALIPDMRILVIGGGNV